MKVKIEQFCSLASSPAWQSWLYHFDDKLYREFIMQLQYARGCTQNQEIMKNLLVKIEERDGGYSLELFLKKQYPYVLESTIADSIFPDYNPKLLTYPRRIIFSGDNIEQKARVFLLDKFKYDLEIVDGRAYVEYLTDDDRTIDNQIPSSNWLIAEWRRKQQI